MIGTGSLICIVSCCCIQVQCWKVLKFISAVWVGTLTTGVGRWRTFQVISGAVALFDIDNVVVGFVALVARVVRRPEPDKAIVTAQHEQRSVDDGHDETFTVSERVTHSVQTAVHSCCHVSTVSCPDADWTVFQPLDCKQSGRRPFKTKYHIIGPYVRYNMLRQLIAAYVSPSEILLAIIMQRRWAGIQGQSLALFNRRTRRKENLEQPWQQVLLVVREHVSHGTCVIKANHHHSSWTKGGP